MAGTEGVMERIVREEFEEVVAGKVCVRDRRGYTSHTGPQRP